MSDAFAYLSVLLSIILGLAIAEVLQGLRSLLLARGQVTQPGKEARAGALSALTFAPARFSVEPSASEGERRAGLAHWCPSEENPLTWRVSGNWGWELYFGWGI